MLSLDELTAARARVAPHLAATPLRPSFAFRERRVFLKLECWQPTGSFKVRGALSRVASLTPAERARGLVTASAGNHALGLAFAAAVLGEATEATVFVPTTAPRAKLAKLGAFPVTVREVGLSYDDAHAEALAHARRTGATYVHAFEDAATAAGQGTVGLEILEQLKETGTIVVPVGGGGLVSGIAAGVKALRPDVRIVAAQPDASPAFSESLRLGRALTEYDAAPTLADGLAGGIGAILWEHRQLVDQVVDVPEAEITRAIVALLTQDQVLAEASGAVGVAGLRAGLIPELDERPVVVVVTGANIDGDVLRRLLAEDA